MNRREPKSLDALLRNLLTFLTCGVVAVCAIAAPPPQAPAPGLLTYIMVLRDPRQVAGHEQDPHPKLVEPDVKGMGGDVVESWSTRRVIRVPQALAEKLAENPYVKYLQPIDTGSGLPPQPHRLSSDSVKDAHPAADDAIPRWYSGDYLYDGSGNIKNIGYGIGETLNSDNASNAYAYDGVGRLTSATVNTTTSRNETYAYDSFGNLLQRTTNGQITTQLNVDPASNRVREAAYDAAGNQKYYGGMYESFDSASRMRQLQTTGSETAYVYDADDERVGVSVGMAYYNWTIRDFDGKVLREYEAGSLTPSATWLWVEDSVYRDGQLVAADRPSAEGGRRHFHSDHLGSPRLITNDLGLRYAAHDYFPFGTEATDFRQEMTEHQFDRAETRQFTGHERDFISSTELSTANYIDYMHARYYSASMGRFLSVDPTLDSADRSRPQSWNRYAYVLNNPVMSSDPDGKCPVFVDCGRLIDAAVWLSSHWPETKAVLSNALNSTPEVQMTVAYQKGDTVGYMNAEAQMMNSALVISVAGMHGTTESQTVDTTLQGEAVGGTAYEAHAVGTLRQAASREGNSE